ncbi:MAG TPA: cobalamin biosynthesis protein [Candidatus Acidoferrales bacterium]|nr:cobalamin biosynthesis protein [Candidatus Acidoferrales bacterium]
MFERGIAVVAITHRGVGTALKIQTALDNAQLKATVYAPQKYNQTGVVVLDKKMGDFAKDIYNQVDAIVSVMATGITIRSVAPLLESKLTDPAVVGVDASGKFVISLLSGHLGGANDLTHIIAQGINAIPVVTTASDILGKLSVDELAKNLHLKIENPDSLVALNSAIVNGDRIVVVLVGEAKIPSNALGSYEVRVAQNGTEALSLVGDFDGGIIITAEPLTITKFTKPFTILKIRKVVVGLGARKESSTDSMIQAVDMALEKVHVPLSRVYAFATVDIKRTSQPMLDAVAKLGAPLEFLSVEALRTVTYGDLSPDSAMVQEKIGIGGVCERAALVVAGPNAKLILKKTILNGVTVAIAEGE